MGDCISCGSKIPKKSRFCPSCGSVIGEESDTQLGRRLSKVRDEISDAQNAINEAKKRWIFEDDGNGANYYWVAGFSLLFIGGIIGGLVAPGSFDDDCDGDDLFFCGPYSLSKMAFFDFMACCFPVIVLTCPPLYVNWKNQRKLVELEIEKKSLQIALGGKGVAATKSHNVDEGHPKPKKWLPK